MKQFSRKSYLIAALVVLLSFLLVACQGPVVSSSQHDNKIIVAVDGTAEKHTTYAVEIKIKDVVYNDSFTTDEKGAYHLTYANKIGNTVLTKDMKISFVATKDGKTVFTDVFEIH